MTKPTFGMTITKGDASGYPIAGADFSIIGLLFHASDADVATFPLDTPVAFSSRSAPHLAALGVAGTGRASIDLINAQLKNIGRSALIVGVRIASGTAPELALAAAGNEADRTGVYAFLDAPHLTGVTPRIIIAPNLTVGSYQGVSALSVTTAGTGYAIGSLITGTGGSGSGFLARVSDVGVDGEILDTEIISSGAGYTSAPTIAIAGGASAVITATIAEIGNPLMQELPAFLERTASVAIPDAPSASEADALAFLNLHKGRFIVPCIGVRYIDDTGSAVLFSAAPAIAGIGVRVDQEHGGLPFHSWANQPIYGIAGVSRPVEFSLLDGATEGQRLLAASGAIIVRGDSSDGAIADGGFVFIGAQMNGDDPEWKFYSQVRGRDYTHLALVKTLRNFLGKRNVNRGLIEDVIAQMRMLCRDLKARDAIIDFRVNFNPATSVDDLRAGRFSVALKQEEPAPFCSLEIVSARYREAIDALLDDLIKSGSGA